MANESTLVSAEHFAYIAARTTQEDDFLRTLRTDAEQAGIPPIQIAPEEAAFLQILLRLIGAREVVEVGTLAGYSAIAMARALPEGGRVRTIEYEAMHAAFARDRFAHSDVAGKLELFEGAGMDVLPRFEDDSADVAFLDADKASYPQYLEEAIRIVRPGGTILVDNAFAFGEVLEENPTDPEAPAVQAFNEQIAKDPRLQAVIVPLGDGLWLAVNAPSS
ncbi:MAG: O-methyltransferase [Planctomycetota bacterium]